MKNTIIIAIAIVLLAGCGHFDRFSNINSCTSQNNKEYRDEKLGTMSHSQENSIQLLKANLRGRVKSVHTTNGSEFIKEYFDEKGRLIKKETKHRLFDNHIYNDQGQLISYDDVYSNGYREPYHLSYDERGFLIKEGDAAYINDENGNCIAMSYPGTDLYRYKYNEKNQVIEEWTYRDEYTVIERLVDANRKPLGDREVVVPAGNNPSTFYEYNRFGDIISRKTSERMDTVTYEYDDRGNWIKRRHTDLSGYIWSSSKIEGLWGNITRIIEYYE
ncbi:MAG: hypothetical protein LBV07_05480 [Syntrophobacterales bacterium]|jgi:YD repeat-containing protein|nr:hypothetical protein [Syntrophobacterales bacterium]